MAGTWSRRGLTALIILSTIVLVENSKLNVPRVLLPVFNSLSLNFTLEGTQRECYKWSTSRPEIINLHPRHEVSRAECSSKVTISTNTKDFVRNTAIVFAEELRTGVIVRCDVIIDVISSLAVITTTRELFIEEAPEAFEIRAYDDQGNEFSTLQGVEFKWDLSAWSSQGGISKGTNVIRFMTFNESPYETPPTVQSLDSRGLRGHIVLLEGLKTGSAKVSVQLPYEEYSNVPPIEVQLSVMSNLIIQPVEVYMMPGDSLQYRVLQVRNGRLEDVELSKQYVWDLEDTSIAVIDSATSTVTAIAVGRTKVQLFDRHADENDSATKVPTAYVVVTSPCYLTLNILPNRNWAVLIGEDYDIVVDIYDKEDHKIHIGKGVEVTTLIPPEFFSTKYITPNGTYIHGEPLEVGTAQVRSTLTSVLDRKGRTHHINPKLSVQANMMIYRKITVRPADVILPWDSRMKMRYEVSLKAEGGDGSYIWSTSNTSIATVTQTGLVVTHHAGQTDVYATMTTNPHNKGTSRFRIAQPEALEIVEYLLESEVGSPVFLHVALFTRRNMIEENSDSTELVPFTRCQEVLFNVQVLNDNFVYNDTLIANPVGIACAVIGLQAAAVGITKVSVSYENALKDFVTIASFLPLRPILPESGEIVLAVGCTGRVVFEGGPVAWVGKPSEHIHSISTGKMESNVVVVSEVATERQDVYEYVVLCRQLGEAEVTLTVSNVPAVKHCRNVEAVASVRVLCAKPRYMTLQTEYVQEKSCPLLVGPERVVIQNYPNTKIFVSVKDEYGNVFQNISSLRIDWSLSDSSLARLMHSDLVHVEGADKDTPQFYQLLKPKKLTGVLEIKASVVGYNSQMLRDLDIVPEYPPFAILDEKGYEITPEITATLSAMLVNDTSILPSERILFNHPNNKEVLELLQGSGYYDVILSTDVLADISYKEGSRRIEIFPKEDGILKIAVADRCLSSEPAVAEIHIVSISSMRVEAPERVEKGRCASGIIRIYDSLENILPVPMPDQIDIRPVFEDQIFGVVIQFDEHPSDPASVAGEIHFVVTGLELGERQLLFASGSGDKEVRSSAVTIQVFPPLRLLPHNITLVVGSVFQVSSRGGPQPDANVEFSLTGSVAKVDNKGLVEGVSIGHSVLVGRAVGFNSVTGQSIVYSQDSIDVFVVPLVGIKIHAPISRIISGATIPIWANGIPEQITPLILGSTSLPVRYIWHISSREIALLNNVYHRIRLTVTERDLISMHLKTLKPGRVTVSLRVIVPSVMTSRNDLKEVEFTSSIEFEVFEVLRLVHPPDAGDLQSPFVLMAPNSETVLRTNHEGSVTFALLEKSNTQVEHTNSTEALSKALSNVQKILTVHKDGRIVSHAAFGRVVILVTAKEDFGLKQIMSVTVEVKAVHYMLVSLRPDFIVKESESISKLPRGTEVELFITYHDNTGVVFTAVEPDIKLRINRFDLTKLTRGQEKNIVLATVQQHGQTMLKMWDDLTQNHAADYVRLKCGEGILPPVHTISVGDVICFSVPFVSNDEHGGNWANDNPAVLELNTELGIGRARAPGTVVVKYHFSETAFTSKEIRVLPLQTVKILPLKEHYITNSNPDAPFRVPIVLRSEQDKAKTTSMISRNGTCPIGYMVSVFPFICTLAFTNIESEYDVDDVFAVHQDFDLDSGEYLCTIEAAGDPPPNLSMLQTNLTLTVQSRDVSSSTLIIRFLPAVYVSTPEVHLTDSQTGTLIINGIPDVLNELQIVASNSFISIERSYEIPTVTSGMYKVVLSDRYWEVGELSLDMNVTVVSHITKQYIQVPLKIHLAGEKGHVRAPCIVSHVSTWSSQLSDTIYAYRHTLMIMATLVVVLVITAYGYTSFIAPINELRRESLIGSSMMYSDRPTALMRPSMFIRQSQFFPRPSVYGRQSMYSDPANGEHGRMYLDSRNRL